MGSTENRVVQVGSIEEGGRTSVIGLPSSTFRVLLGPRPPLRLLVKEGAWFDVKTQFGSGSLKVAPELRGEKTRGSQATHGSRND